MFFISFFYVITAYTAKKGGFSMGIYKVIKIKLPKLLQNKKLVAVKGAVFKKKNRTKNKKKNIKRYKKAPALKKRYKKHKKTLKKGNISFKYVAILLFFVLILIKCVTMFSAEEEQQQSQNTTLVTETKQNFFIHDSLP